MGLSTVKNEPSRLLEKGEHLGFKWSITHSGIGFRCGYCRIPKGHPWYGKGYNEIEASAHGGLTYAEHDESEDGYWVGFDCGHFLDAPDPELLAKTNKSIEEAIKWIGCFDGEIRTQGYVVAECIDLCRQAHEAMEEKTQ